MNGIRIPVFCFIILLNLVAKGQQFGAFPPSVKWKAIDTDTARVIFEGPVESQAQRIASIIHRIAGNPPYSLGDRTRKINIVLHSNTTLANGYVAMAPFRSEYYLIPGSNVFEFGANPWQEELAVHEYRHVQQFNNFKNGASKVASYIFGEEGQALLNAIAIPDYFWEGDAVVAETSLTPQGRGRTPYFFNGFNAIFREQRGYSWAKLRNGSLKDYVPNHYNLGYLLVNYGYLKYGPEFWKNVTHDATSYKHPVYPFQAAIKKFSGVNYETFRTEALKFYSHDVSRRRIDKRTGNQTVTDYAYPQQISDDSLLYLKSSYKSLPAFYIKDSTGEHKISLKAIGTEDWFSYRNGIIAYTGYEVNHRWSLIDYNNIYLLNLSTGKEQKITRKIKYFSPDLSPKTNSIVAVAVDKAGESEIHWLNAKGDLIKKHSSTNGAFYFNPRFIDEHTIVVAERLPNSAMDLVLMDLNTGNKDPLVPATVATIGQPYFNDGVIYFVSSVAGNDDLYAVRLKDRNIYQLGTSLFSRYYPSVYQNTLSYSKFTSYGMEMEQIDLRQVKQTQVSPLLWKSPVLPYAVAGNDSVPNVLKTPTRKFTFSDYGHGKLFNFHSWRPEYEDPEFTLSFYSDNILNTFSNSVFYRYNQNETSHAVGFNSYYGGLFPMINAGATYTFDRTIKRLNNTYTFNDVEGRVGYNIPLNFTGSGIIKDMAGKTFKYLDFGTDLVYKNISPQGITKDSFPSRSDIYLDHFVTFSQQLPRAVQQIYPKFGYALAGFYRHLLNKEGFQFLGNGRLVLPSFGNHSIVVGGSMQETDTSNITFTNRYSNARGYTNYFFAHMWKLTGNYHMPLIYPDKGVGNIIYLMRLRSNFFYDYSKVFSNSRSASRELRSIGTELFFDTKIWNELPFTFGIRMSHLLDNDFNNRKAGSNVFELVVPVGLVPAR